MRLRSLLLVAFIVALPGMTGNRLPRRRRAAQSRPGVWSDEQRNVVTEVGQRVAVAVEGSASLEEIGNLSLKQLSQPVVVYIVME
jgi:hypothetical protein